jgi:hypothetical protein
MAIRRWYFGLALLLAMSLAMGAGEPPPRLTLDKSPTPPTVPAGGPAVAPAAPAQTSPMDEPLRLLGAARQAYADVRDYTCLLIKRERMQGQLQPDHLITMRVRTQPFSVYLQWQEPKALAGQEACYVTGRNNGMMRAHATGLSGLVGFVSIDPRDPRAMEHSRHCITEAGIGHLIERYSQSWEEERRRGRTEVHIGDFEYNKRPCTRVETIHSAGAGTVYYRSLVYFDKETHLPIRTENYDWPKPRGNPDGDLAEVYSYVDLRLNVRLGDEAFNY